MNHIKALQVKRLEDSKKDVRHVLHAILSLATAFLWVPVWVLIVLHNMCKNKQIDRKVDALINDMYMSAAIDKQGLGK